MHPLAKLNPQSVKVDNAKRKSQEIQNRLAQLMAGFESKCTNAAYLQQLCHDIGSLQRELSECLCLLDEYGEEV
ncbi:hypothetical protein HUO09_17690 [Vibrio sp. Y2-5]|uniref:hypothetical protein n=1 Tax=Vibrio sp. Y2-5 TaxID=2743977 RepID=UPI0016603349|nr:hypothetical protein [Vibrio sp. Y2-5]MBD0788191.1 hypothetical protein [Vibrio sp. Y2-5]